MFVFAIIYRKIVYSKFKLVLFTKYALLERLKFQNYEISDFWAILKNSNIIYE